MPLRRFLLLCVGKVLILGPWLVWRDFEWSYPFFGGDGADWLSNGLALGGEALYWSGRQPGLPLVLALLDALGALRFFPWVGLAWGGALAALTFALAQRGQRPDSARSSSALALAAGGLILANGTLTRMSYEVMADLPAIVLAAAALVAWLGGRRPLGLFLGILAGCFQLTGSLFAAAACLAADWPKDIPTRRERVRRLAAKAAWGLAFVAPGAQLSRLLQQLPQVTPTVPQDQAALLVPGFGGLAGFLASWLEVAGVPLAILSSLAAIHLAVRWVRRRERSAVALPALAWLAAVVLFHGFLYQWRADRFAAAAIVPALLLVVDSLNFWPKHPASHGPAIGVAMAVFLGFLATPAGVDAWVAPWLLRQRESPASLDLAVARRTAHSAHSVIALVNDGTPPAAVRDLRGRLGNALRRRVKVLPAAVFQGAPGKAPALSLSFAGGQLTPWESWVFYRPDNAPPDSVEMPDPPPIGESDLARIERHLDGADGLLAIAAESPSALDFARAIFLQTRTVNVYWVDRATAERLIERRGEAANPSEPARVGPFALLHGHYAASPVVVLLEGSPGSFTSFRATEGGEVELPPERKRDALRDHRSRPAIRERSPAPARSSPTS